MRSNENISRDSVYVSLSDAAHLLGVTYQTVYRWTKDGKLSAVRLGGGRMLRIEISEFKRFLQ